MKGKRIRYKEHKIRENVLESIQVFTSEVNGARYKVRLDLNNNTYEIKNLSSEFIFRGGDSINNINVLKRAAKKRLEELGVSFQREERDRTFGLCNKGYNQKKHTEEGNEGFGRTVRD